MGEWWSRRSLGVSMLSDEEKGTLIYLGAIVDGILLGGLFAGVAVGLSLVFGIANLLNLAHGAFIVLGAYTALALQQALGLHIFVAAPIAAAIAFMIGWSIYRWGGLARIMQAPILMVIVFTFGLDLVIVHGIAFALRSAKPKHSGTGFRK